MCTMSGSPAVASGDGDGDGDSVPTKAPVITEQPPGKMVATVGEDLVLQLKVKGESPLRYVPEPCTLTRD